MNTNDKRYTADTLRNALNLATWTEPPEPKKGLTPLAELDRQLSEMEVDPAYAEYTVRSIY